MGRISEVSAATNKIGWTTVTVESPETATNLDKPPILDLP